MSTSIQNAFDFPGFTRALTESPRDLLSEVEREIKGISNRPKEDIVSTLRKIAYKIKLQHLHTFLRTGEIPADVALQEEEVYERLDEFPMWID